jgi:signal transduction histidine kinase
MLLSGSGAGFRHSKTALGSRHLIQFYEKNDFLAGVVARFLVAGLKDGDSIVVIATERRRRTLLKRLVAFDVPLDQVLLLDARELLARLMPGGVLDAYRCKQVIGPLLEDALQRSSTASVRAFGEMNDLLCQDRNSVAALALEEQLNQLLRDLPLTLLCGYSLANFATQKDGAAFESLCGAHSHVFPTERYSEAESLNARMREVSSLQQRAKVLETEVAHFKRVEHELLHALRLRDDFLADAGRELKTPLTVLQLQLSSLRGRVKEEADSELGEWVHRALRQTERIALLAEELVDLSRRKRKTPSD